MTASLLEQLADLPKAEVDALIRAMAPGEANAFEYDWRYRARPEQLPPDGSWRIWLLMAGRGFGKTRSGGRLARSTAVRFFAVLSRARALRAITQSAPARPRTQRASRNQSMASAKEARNHGADGSRCYGQQRSHPTGWKTVHRLNFLSI